MVTSLIKHERIETTQAKAKEIRRTAEKLVTRAKLDSVHNRRIAAKTIFEKDVLNKLFTVVGPRFTQRPGGYTRILKMGLRRGDAAEMVILEFIPDEAAVSAKGKSAAKNKGEKNKPEKSDKAQKAETGKGKPAKAKADGAGKAKAKKPSVSEQEVSDSPDTESTAGEIQA
jgi:large subunit ribosomal protein L17